MLTVDSTDQWADTTLVELDNEEGNQDTVTFEDASQPGGARQEFLTVNGVQSTDSDSLWSYLWDNAGTEVPFVYAPHANETPTASQPHFTGTCRIGPRPKLGGGAGRETTFTFETRWDVVGAVVKDTGAA